MVCVDGVVVRLARRWAVPEVLACGSWMLLFVCVVMRPRVPRVDCLVVQLLCRLSRGTSVVVSVSDVVCFDIDVLFGEWGFSSQGCPAGMYGNGQTGQTSLSNACLVRLLSVAGRGCY